VEASDESAAVVVVIRGAPVDLASVDLLARLQLAAGRLGWSLQLRDASDELRELLAFVGLDEVLTLEPRREAEEREQLGIQEVVQPGDPPV
jgi:hypothetical protein